VSPVPFCTTSYSTCISPTRCSNGCVLIGSSQYQFNRDIEKREQSTSLPNMTGIKHDTNKSMRPELITSEFIEELSKVLAYGAHKYSDRNWEKGMKWSRPFGALLRHIWSWWKGETNDPETGFSHMAHAACNVMFLLTYEKRRVGEDDREYQEYPIFKDEEIRKNE
jgi:hypothetical protein